MNKKLKIIVGIIISIIILWMIIFLIDYTRVSHFKEPIFVIKGEVLNVSNINEAEQEIQTNEKQNNIVIIK